MLRPSPSSTHFPYTTLFRSAHFHLRARRFGVVGVPPRGAVERHAVHALRRERADLHAGQVRAFRVRDVEPLGAGVADALDRKSTRLNSSHSQISYAVFCLKK